MEWKARTNRITRMASSYDAGYGMPKIMPITYIGYQTGQADNNIIADMIECDI